MVTAAVCTGTHGLVTNDDQPANETRGLVTYDDQPANETAGNSLQYTPYLPILFTVDGCTINH